MFPDFFERETFQEEMLRSFVGTITKLTHLVYFVLVEFNTVCLKNIASSRQYLLFFTGILFVSVTLSWNGLIALLDSNTLIFIVPAKY